MIRRASLQGARLLSYGNEMSMRQRTVERPRRRRGFTRGQWRVAWLVAASALGLGACGGGGAPGELTSEGPAEPGRIEQPILGGETDREHIAVLAIATITPDSEGLCTGTLIAPNLVLTARHCVVPVESDVVDCESSIFPAPHAPNALWVSPSTVVRGANLYPVREVFVPEDDGALCGADIALLLLDGQFSDAVTPIAPRLDVPAARGEAFTAVGFGTALDEGAAGIRRALGGVQVVCGPEQCGAPSVLTGTEFVGERAVCEGDSGGPALDEAGQVLGVASRTGDDCTWAIYSAVSPWRDWILAVAERAVAAGDYDAPAWIRAAAAAAGEGAASDELGGGAGSAVSMDGMSGLGEVAEGGGASMGAAQDAVESAPAAPELEDLESGAGLPSAAGSGSGCTLGPAPAAAPWRSLGLVGLALTLLRRARRRAVSQ